MAAVDGLHYCPDNGWFGDAMPVFRDGIYHIYFNKPPRIRDKRQGAYRGGWGHIATKDFLAFEEYPDAFPYEESENGRHFGNPVNSGCVFHGEGEWHAYYAGTHPGSGTLCIRHAVSRDGISFRYAGEVFERPPEWYRIDGNLRDPAVFRCEDDGLYHMVFCAKASESGGGPNCYSGSVGHAVSRDLYRWECLKPLSIGGVANTMECPEIRRDTEHGRWILLYYYHETRIRTADSLTGPWERGETIAPNNFNFMAGRTMYDGTRLILIGWLGEKNPSGGIAPRCMLYPRELRLLEDGKTPAVRFIRELTRQFCIRNTDIAAEKIVPGGPGWHVSGTTITVDHPDGGTAAGWKKLPTVCYIRMELTLSDENGEADILLGTSHGGWNGSPEKDWLDRGIKLIVDMSAGLLRVREHGEWDQEGELTILPYRFRAGSPIRLEILRDGGILEIGVCEERTAAVKTDAISGGHFGISVQDTAAVIENLSVWEPGADR